MEARRGEIRAAELDAKHDSPTRRKPGHARWTIKGAAAVRLAISRSLEEYGGLVPAGFIFPSCGSHWLSPDQDGLS